MKRNASLTLVFILLGFFNAFALDFEVAPIAINFAGSPGETITRTVAVRNHSNRRETISLRQRDYLVYREGNMEVLPGESTKNTIARWITINPSFVVLEPNEEMLIQVSIQAPQDDYTAKWGIISFESTAEQTSFAADKSVRAGVTMLGRIDIYLTFNPLSVPDRVNINSIQEVTKAGEKERTFSVNIENIGDKITNCKVYLIASNLATGEEKRFKTTEISAYPQSSRLLQLVLPNDLQSGQYSLAAILDHAGSATLKGTQMIITVE